MFRFADSIDIILMIIGSIGAIVSGTAIPSFAYIWGLSTDTFLDPD